jgi:hypothetical protein
MAEEVLRFRVLGDDSNFQNSMRNVGSSLSKVGKSVGKATLSFAKWGSVAVAGATVALGGLVYKLGETADEIGDMAAATGQSADQVQEWGYICKVAGADQNQLNKAIMKSGMTQEKFKDTITAISKIEDPTLRMRTGYERFGKQWETIADIAGAGDLEKLAQEAHKVGAVMSGETLDGLNSFRENIDKLKQTGQALLGTALAPLAPALGNISDKISEGLPTIQILIKEGIDKLKQAFIFLKPYILQAMNMFKSFFSETQAGGQVIKFIAELWKTYGKDIMNTVKLLFTTIISNWKSGISIINSIWKVFGNDIKSYIKGVVAAVIQIVNGFLNVLQGIFKLIASVLKGDWKGAWDAIKQIGKGLADIVVGIIKAFFNQIKLLFSAGVTVIKGIWGQVKYSLMSGIDGGVNYVIGRINEMIGKINSAISLINKIPGVNLPSVKNIPQTRTQTLKGVYSHASGGILTKPTFSGNHLAGERGAEAIIPLTNKQYTKPFAQTIADLIGTSNNGVTINMYGLTVREEADITKISRQLQYEIDKKSRAKGVR